MPFFGDFIYLYAHADAVHLLVNSQGADGDGNIVFTAIAIHHICEEKCFAVTLRQPAPKLPTDQGMHLGILVHRLVYGPQETGVVQRFQVILKIPVFMG